MSDKLARLAWLLRIAIVLELLLLVSQIGLLAALSQIGDQVQAMTASLR